MEKICDLHTHSCFSDGSYTPQELIDAAIKAGIGAIAMTDHNTADGLPHFVAAAQGKDIDVVPGVEFSVDYEGRELHLLGLFIKPIYFSQIAVLMREFRERKERSNLELIDALARVGVVLDYDAIKKAAAGYVNRLHIAVAMEEKGYVSSRSEAFDGLLSPGAGLYKEPKRVTLCEMLDIIHSIGAVSVLAHPFFKWDEPSVTRLLPQAKAAGLVGMECYYSTYDEPTTQAALRLARENGLLPSGGSDFHGAGKPDISLGVGRGNLQIPYAWYEALREKAM